jgi:hypothetical protein
LAAIWGRVDEPLEVGHLADVGVDLDRPTPGRSDLRDHVVGRFGVRHVVDHDVGTVGGEPQRDGLADPAVATGHDRDLAFEPACHLATSSVCRGSIGPGSQRSQVRTVARGCFR